MTRIKGNDHLTVEGEKRDQIKADYSLTVEASLHQKLGQSLLVEAGQEVHIKVGDKLVLEAGSEITLKGGGSFVKVDPSGIKRGPRHQAQCWRQRRIWLWLGRSASHHPQRRGSGESP